MAAINEAYRVLGDPGRRAIYDRELGGPAAHGVPAPGRRAAPGPDESPAPDLTPARIPWKLMAWMAALGAVVVLIGATLIEPAAEEPPDGLLEIGSCVELQLNREVREVRCSESAALVVEGLVPADGRCPVGTAGYRDQLGLGLACVVAADDG